MIKHVTLLVLLGNVLIFGPKEASGKKYSPVHHAQLDNVHTFHATTKKDLRKNNVVHLVKNARKTNNVLDPKLVTNQSIIFKIELENPSGKIEKADDVIELAEPKLYKIPKSDIDNFIENLMKKNIATINKLQKMKLSSAEVLEDSKLANKNIEQLNLMKKQVNKKKREKNIQFLCWIGPYWDALEAGDLEKAAEEKAKAEAKYASSLAKQKATPPDTPVPSTLQNMQTFVVRITVDIFKLLRQQFSNIFKLKLKTEATLEVSHEEPYNECPTACPTEREMVCARCKDGVYKTFVSVCHMRMFNCKHPDEKLKLVARRPCILSAPYARNFDKIQDPPKELKNNDPVMRHIWCLKHYKIVDDPRCDYLQFLDKKIRLPFWIGGNEEKGNREIKRGRGGRSGLTV